MRWPEGNSDFRGIHLKRAKSGNQKKLTYDNFENKRLKKEVATLNLVQKDGLLENNQKKKERKTKNKKTATSEAT